MIVPNGFVAVVVPLHNVSLSRTAVITYGVEDIAGTVNPQTIADDIQGVMDGDFVNRLDTNVTMGPVQVYVGAVGGTVPGTAAGSFPGQLNIASPPPNVAVLVHKNTTLGGRKGRGRMFIPWYVDKGSIDEAGGIDGTQRTNINNSLDNMLTALDAADYPMRLLHNDSTVPSAVTGLTVDSRVATQRNRLGR